MSFILDALRKAESGPTPAPAAGTPIVTDKVPAAPADLVKRFQFGGIALALVAATAAVTWWLGRAPAPTTAPAPSVPSSVPSSVPASAPATTPAQPPAARREPVRALNREAARAMPAPAEPRTPPPSPAAAPARTASTSGSTLPPPGTKGTVTIMPEVNFNQSVDESSGAQDSPQDSVPAPLAAAASTAAPSAPPATRADENLPQYENLLRAGRINLPNLNMDIHVYNRVPAKRFVYVNLRKYREGAALDARTQIEEITPNGAVILHNGQRFLLRPN